ncbi:MAG: putative DNA binding domain-containing protein [Flavobacteriales bacterium]|jgi:ATP-dependent DNA helicase RecG|nr:putative DNA binding domain-containing protein [Flavobacteriales bacterium]
MSALSATEVKELARTGETLTVEFKGEERKPLNDRDLVLACICLANTDGGTLLVGVEKDGRITGARARHEGGTDTDKVRAVIRNLTVPPLEVGVSTAIVEGNTVLVLDVPKADRVVANTEGTCVHRVMATDGPACVAYHPHEHGARGYGLGAEDLTAQAAPHAHWSDLDPLQFERARNTITARSGDKVLLTLGDAELAKAIGAIVSVGDKLVPTYAGLLLFGREEALTRHVPTHEAAFQVLTASAEVRVNDFFRKPLLETAELIEERFNARNEEKEVQVGLIRVPVPDYSAIAFREALLNALLHRDFRVNNAVYVQWHPDRITLDSPGGFPEGVRANNLLTHEPKPRNRHLYQAAKRLGLVEQSGRGVDKVYMGQLRYGRPIPDYERSDNTGVRLTLLGGRGSLAFAAYVFQRERSGKSMALNEMIALNRLYHDRRLTTDMLAGDIQAGLPEARSVLERLVEEGLVQAKGERRGRVYHFSAEVYEAIGQPEAHARVHGMERGEQEEAVLELLRAAGQVQRKHVMERCGLTGDQATRLLNAMLQAGRLKVAGVTRDRWYRLPEVPYPPDVQ